MFLEELITLLTLQISTCSSFEDFQFYCYGLVDKHKPPHTSGGTFDINIDISNFSEVDNEKL